MEVGDVEKIVELLDSSISAVKWKMRSSAKRRLEIDILALCTGVRAVVMVDYGGKMPELQEHLWALLTLIKKESSILMPLKIMVIEDMIYIVHSKGLAEHTFTSLSLQQQLLFVDIEHDPPKMLSHTEQNIVISELSAAQKSILSVFPVVEVSAESSQCKNVDPSSVSERTSPPTEIIDLSRIVENTQLTLPTLNGTMPRCEFLLHIYGAWPSITRWLLGYPVVYSFRKDYASNAVYNLSTKSLHIYKITIRRKQSSSRKSCEEELMSFTVPYELSLGMEKEPWAEAFLSRLSSRFERCGAVWTNIQLEACECYPQSVVL